MSIIASRSLYAGDTYPPVLLQVSDETGVLDLSSAQSILIQWIGNSFQFSGPGVPLTPPQPDPVSSNTWNLRYDFAAGDTGNADSYTPYVVVTWSAGEIETFPTEDTLTVLTLP